jgi:signal transduction histidine kinase
VLATARVPAILLSHDRHVKFVSDDAAQLLGIAIDPEYPTLKSLESKLGFALPDIRQSYSATIKVARRPVEFSIVPISGGAGGSVVVLRPRDDLQASVITYIREAVMQPLRELEETLSAAAGRRGAEPLLGDAASTLEQILSSIELAPSPEEQPKKPARPSVTVSESIRRVTERFRPTADIKGVRLQGDPGDVSHACHDHQELEDVLGILVENSLHYVPNGGQIVVGLRQLEHKGRPLLLFFVMDNGPIVPEEMREEIFSPDYRWDPNSLPRSGRALARCRSFASAHGGQLWVESKTGKACTFFLRIRPS